MQSIAARSIPLTAVFVQHLATRQSLVDVSNTSLLELGAKMRALFLVHSGLAPMVDPQWDAKFLNLMDRLIDLPSPLLEVLFYDEYKEPVTLPLEQRTRSLSKSGSGGGVRAHCHARLPISAGRWRGRPLQAPLPCGA